MKIDRIDQKMILNFQILKRCQAQTGGEAVPAEKARRQAGVPQGAKQGKGALQGGRRQGPSGDLTWTGSLQVGRTSTVVPLLS